MYSTEEHGRLLGREVGASTIQPDGSSMWIAEE